MRVADGNRTADTNTCSYSYSYSYSDANSYRHGYSATGPGLIRDA